MRWLVFGLLTVHGLLHLLGVARAFGHFEHPQLTRPISASMGLLWLAASLGLLAAAVLSIAAPRIWWAAGVPAIVLSQLAIASAWPDAKAGTLVNLVLLTLAVYAFASQGPLSSRADYERQVRERVGSPPPPSLITESDLSSMPLPVRRYLRVAGAVGRPRVRHFRASWRGRIRGGPDEPWMTFTAAQHNFVREPSRFFLMHARRSGLPVDVYHAFQNGAATMRVRLLSMIPLVNASGPELTRAESVTLFNDLSLLAPGGLVDAPIRWETIDSSSVLGHYTAGPNTVSAVLHFNEAGELVDFVSDDRLAASPDGTEFVRQRWSTPVEAYRDFGGWRVMSRGEGRWHPPEGEFVYFEAELLELEVNGGS